MLKRLGIAIVVLAVVAGLAGVVLAQDDAPPAGDLCPFDGECQGHGMGGNGMMDHGMMGNGMMGHGMMGHGYAGSMPALLAEALGMTTEELLAAQTDGQTVAEMAAAQGVELADVVAAVLAPRAEGLAQAVADGRITQEQADTMLATMTEHMTARFQESGVGYGGGCGMGGGKCGTDDTGTSGGRGHRGGMRGGCGSMAQGSGA